MFEKATRMKLRFATPIGLLTTEDVWDLPLLAPKGRKANLDDLAKSLYKELKEDDTQSFVLKKDEPNEELVLKFEVVRHVIKVRLEEQEEAEKLKRSKEKKDMIMSIIADKENEELKGKSLDDLRSLLDSL